MSVYHSQQSLGRLFPQTSFIGFDRLISEIERVAEESKHGIGVVQYPPHNVVKISETKSVIELAVAGFKFEELDIEIKDSIITITGIKSEEDKRDYAHKGISSRKFIKKFNISEHTVVTGAKLDSGILSIELELRIPEEQKPRKIKIG